MKFSHRSHAHGHIHRTLKKHSPRGVHKAKKLVGFKYPKLFLLIICIGLAYYIFRQPEIIGFTSTTLERFSHFGMFIAGILFAFGFSTPFSIGFFLIANPENIFLATLFASLGSVFADMIIFKTIKFSFLNEFEELKKKKIIRKIEKIVEDNKHVLIRHYLLYIFAGIMIATPLPDELGVSMLAGLTTIRPWKLAAISFLLHAAVIIVMFLV